MSNSTPETTTATPASTIEKLFSVGAHYGYARSRRHPSVSRYIFGNKGGVEIFDLEKTVACLEAAIAFTITLAAQRKIVLFVGGKAEARRAVSRAADRLGMPYVASRWIGGTFTNFTEIRKRINRLTELSEMREKGELARFTKKERLLIDREITDLENTFGGLRGMSRLPDAIFVVDPKHESKAVEEARQMNIPVIALLNTDCSAADILYPIPASDASLQSISHILDEVSTAYLNNLGAVPVAPEVPVALAVEA